MGSIFAFLAGINAYAPRLARPLHGCVNDVTAACELLTRRTNGAARTAVALDGEATVAVVEDSIRRFLGAAGSGDTALFWFSGHGTHTWATGADLLIEATGRNQALLCADGPLPDKRLGALLDAVAARGAHVAAVLDCCFSGGATRAPDGLTARFAPPTAKTPPPSPPPPMGSRDVPVREDAARHVLLAASRLDQLSYEGNFGGRPHGAFTHALLGAVRDAGPDATYRDLLAAADARVQRGGVGQQPVLYPAAPGGAADLPFLGGAVARAPGPHLLRLGVQGWEVDCGTGHGLPDGAEARGTEFRVVEGEGEGESGSGGERDGGGAPPGCGPAAPDAAGGRARRARARRVHTARTLVDPVEWEPDGGRVYPVVLSALAIPPATVSFEPAPAEAPTTPAEAPATPLAPAEAPAAPYAPAPQAATAPPAPEPHTPAPPPPRPQTDPTTESTATAATAATTATPATATTATTATTPQHRTPHPQFHLTEHHLTQALHTSGPARTPSPLLRPAPSPDERGDLHFRVQAGDGLAHVLRRDGTPYTAPLPLTGPDDVRRITDCLAHLTRWHGIRDLAARPSVLDNLVQVEIAPWGAPPGEALVPNGSGEIVCAYGPEGAESREPWVSVRLHNRSPGRTLWCVLLDLTDSYASHSALFPGHFIGPGRTGHALDGDPVQLSLPTSRPAAPGAYARDWLKLIVAEGELNTVPFHLPAWDATAATARSDAPDASYDPGVLRFDAPELPAGSRDLGGVAAGSPGRWATRTISLRTVVPGGSGGQRADGY
ncbi:caspase family protein [Streptomyces aureoverticillatus]|uniref:caspase family protein n=1 Tax=Streptomyces aureoverticillatus TaxID=66871 RepID=UPI0013DBF1B2|nr:caspase family protein [Streptomyces aureoverticillatus]QIB43846.1 caspase family protein [Streptomyces aureoverticillatus]